MKQTSTASFITVHEGRTLIYIFPAVFCGIAALISFFFFFPVAIPLIALVVILSLTETGLDYDPTRQQYRKYKALFGKKWGEWHQLTLPEKFELHLSVERAYSRNAFSQVGSVNYGRQSTEIARSVTYDLSYSSAITKRQIIFEFQSYKIAKKFLLQIEDLGTFPVIDHIAIKLQENKEKRMNRMR